MPFVHQSVIHTTKEQANYKRDRERDIPDDSVEKRTVNVAGEKSTSEAEKENEGVVKVVVVSEIEIDGSDAPCAVV